VKLLRTLQPGEHPDVEMTRYLTLDAEFPHTPVLLGVAEFTDANVVAVAGMMQEYLPESVDAWHFALDVARPYFAAPAGREAANAFLDQAEHLGRVTRELHEALARGTTPAFKPEPVTRERLAAWANGAREWITNGLALLEQQLRAKALPKERMGEAEALVRRRGHFIDSTARIVDEVANDAGAAIRIHGDYHLGQVLRTARNDFMIIDFEGEPLRSLDERRQKASPLRDVAGMLRSFAYAAATLGMEAKGADIPTRELRIGRWERDSREAFLRGYLQEESGGAAAKGTRILPRDGTSARSLLRLFEIEKAFYELMYELNNRPDWAWIPMRGIAKLL
jgi:maltose alpha-D-glucosyltransferase/alpha-amylase